MRGGLILLVVGSAAAAQPASLAPPRFHHLHLNSTDPAAAIAFYRLQFPTTSATRWASLPALVSPDNVLVVFNKVRRAPNADAQATAYWHFGWNVIDARKSVEAFRAQRGLLVPFYSDDTGGFVGISSDTYPYPPGVNGRTKAQLAEAKAQGLQPRRMGGNGYIFGPDGAVIEFTGNAPAERIDHVHMWQEQPVCAQLWYERHLNAQPRRSAPGAVMPTEADCMISRGTDRTWPALDRQGTFRTPSGGVVFSGVALNWYANQTERPLAPTRGRLIDHVGLAVADLDGWIAKLRGEGVTFLRQPYRIGGRRAVMIEGPSREAIELIDMP